MSAQVIELVSVERVDEAWQSYASEARRLIDQPHLIADREFNERLARKHKAWLRLFYLQEREP